MKTMFSHSDIHLRRVIFVRCTSDIFHFVKSDIFAAQMLRAGTPAPVPLRSIAAVSGQQSAVSERAGTPAPVPLRSVAAVGSQRSAVSEQLAKLLVK